MSVVVRFPYDEIPVSGDVCGAGRTKQSFRNEVDVNFIVNRARKGGALCDPSLVNVSRRPMYGDFTDGSDFMSVQNRIAQVRSLFDKLPAVVRARFSNDPSEMLDFVSLPENAAACVDLGLLSAEDVSVPPEPVSVPSEPVPAPVQGAGA